MMLIMTMIIMVMVTMRRLRFVTRSNRFWSS